MFSQNNNHTKQGTQRLTALHGVLMGLLILSSSATGFNNDARFSPQNFVASSTLNILDDEINPLFHMPESSAQKCNATARSDWSVGVKILKEITASSPAECCADCLADSRCLAYVLHGTKCYLKADADGGHTKPGNTGAVVRGSPGPPAPPTPPPSPGPPPPPGSPKWELVHTIQEPVIGRTHPDVIAHTIQSGFETGQYFRLNGTYYYTANELGTCPHPGVLWDLVTRAAVWSAPNSSGPWSRVATIRNGSHIQTVCKPATATCDVPCHNGLSCCSGTKENPSFVRASCCALILNKWG